MSLVDMQPSESIRSNVTRVASRRAASRSSGVGHRVGREHDEHRGQPGASMPAPLAIPPTDQPSATCGPPCGTVSVVMMASAAAAPPSEVSAAAAASTPASSRSIGSRSPIRPVEQTTTSPDEQPSRAAMCSAVRCVSAKPSGPGAGVGAAGVEHDGVRPVVGEHLAAPGHRGGLDAVAGEHGRRVVVRAVVDDQRDVRASGGLQPGGDAGGAEARGKGRDSRRYPRIGESLALGQAEGDVEALHDGAGGALGEVVHGGDDDDATGVFVDATCSRTTLLPRTSPVAGQRLSGRSTTNGSSA